MFKSRKPVQHLIIVPISLDLEKLSERNSTAPQEVHQQYAKEYALQYKKHSTAFVESFQRELAQEGDSAVELRVSTRKSAIRLLILEHSKKRESASVSESSVGRGTVSNGGNISKKYKLRLSLQDLVHDRNSEHASEWKVITVTLKDGNQLVMRSKRLAEDSSKIEALNRDSIAPSNMSDDEDLSTVIMNAEDRDTTDELYLHIEERELEIKNLKLRLKEMHEQSQSASQLKDDAIFKLKEQITALQAQNEQSQESLRKSRQITMDKEREYDVLLHRSQQLEAKLKELHGTTDRSTSSVPQKFKGHDDPMWIQKSLQLYNHVNLLEQEIFSLKQLFDYDRMHYEEKESDLIKKLRYYQQRDERIQREKLKLIEFVSQKESAVAGTKEKNSGKYQSTADGSSTPSQFAASEIENLPEQLKSIDSPLDRLQVILDSLSEFLIDRIETEPHDRLLSDVFNPVMKIIVQQLVKVLSEIMGSGLTGPWRLTRRNNIWDLISQTHMNSFTRNNKNHQALSEEELIMYYAVRSIRKHSDEKYSGSDWEPRFRSWVCAALNKQSLHAWINLILKDDDVVQSYYDTTKSLLFVEKQRLDSLLSSIQNVPFSLSEM
mmetsp:Transcript_9180/g.33894  ORF Transcript_9180/g.33894 Transcript_9180/m.33894 type:complete len:606 (-) Transcript_9180:66-1883(-)|eukprot:CAMPEP_0117444454 /NCGR_PEP_ID=MMETSP0759-20121206/5249_1 /TAXON_ID=63605 /ORGANISM="Percolomonas cosmopolitus, Strain WS" /LENGTH=605 /DNA_ID=CAMNT_0005236521 /DNA_START=305 /DNA_END=2122 /DNA_ORIENTATION=-